MADRRIEVNPGEWFMVGNRVVLTESYESVLGMLSKIGTIENDRLAYLITFKGRINNTDRETTVTVAMSPEDVNVMIGDLLNGLELLVSWQEGASGD